MANLRAGMVGIGSMGKNHVRNLRAIDGVDLVAIADASGKDPFGVAGDLPILPDVDAVIETGVDYCVVAAPTKFHEEIGLKLAEAGVHALIEKPLAYDTTAAKHLAEAFASRGLVGAVGHIERYNPALQSLRKRLENGDLGDLYQVATRRQGPFPARIADVGDTGRERSLAAGGHLVEIAEVAILQTLAQRLQGRVVPLDVSDGPHQTTGGERLGEVFGSGGVVGQRLLDEGVHTRLGKLETDLLVELRRSGDDTVVDTGLDDGVHVGQDGQVTSDPERVLAGGVCDGDEVDTVDRPQVADVVLAHRSDADHAGAQVRHHAPAFAALLTASAMRSRSAWDSEG